MQVCSLSQGRPNLYASRTFQFLQVGLIDVLFVAQHWVEERVHKIALRHLIRQIDNLLEELLHFALPRLRHSLHVCSAYQHPAEKI